MGRGGVGAGPAGRQAGRQQRGWWQVHPVTRVLLLSLTSPPRAPSLAHHPQGSAADLAKAAMVGIHGALARELPPGGARLVLQIHDEFLLEVAGARCVCALEPSACTLCGCRGLSAGDGWAAASAGPQHRATPAHPMPTAESLLERVARLVQRIMEGAAATAQVGGRACWVVARGAWPGVVFRGEESVLHAGLHLPTTRSPTAAARAAARAPGGGALLGPAVGAAAAAQPAARVTRAHSRGSPHLHINRSSLLHPRALPALPCRPAAPALI